MSTETTDKFDIDEDIVSRAQGYATMHHRAAGNTYGDKPYSAHLKDVVAVARKYLILVTPKDQTNVLVACWCHDLIEDAKVKYHELEKLFGHKTTEIIYAVTDELGRNRKERALKTYLKMLNNPLAVFVKLCDRIANTKHSRTDNAELYNMYKREFVHFQYILCTNGYWNRYKAMWMELRNNA